MSIRTWLHCDHKRLSIKWTSHHCTINSLNHWYKARWIHDFMLFILTFDPTIRMSQQRLRVIWPGDTFTVFYCPMVVSPCSLRFLPLAEGSGKPWHSDGASCAHVKRCSSERQCNFQSSGSAFSLLLCNVSCTLKHRLLAWMSFKSLIHSQRDVQVN